MKHILSGARVLVASILHAQNRAPNIDMHARAVPVAGWQEGGIRTQNNGLSPGSSELEPLLSLAKDMGDPVGMHIGSGMPGHAYFSSCRDYQAKLTNALELEKALLRHPGRRVYMMHPRFLRSSDEVIERYHVM